MVTKGYSCCAVSVELLQSYNDVQWLVLWQNQKATTDVLVEGNIATISIEQAWKESKGRSFIRVYAYADGKKLNDLLIPMENGEVLNNVAQLTRHDDQAQILYSLMIDRFENGNKKNDWKMNSPEVLDIVDYQGGDIAGITKKIKEGFFTDLGITTIWISPITQNPWDAWGYYPFKKGNKYDPSKIYTKFSGYHGYWPIYTTQVEKRFTTEEELHEMLAVAHEKGIKVILDYVANHIIGKIAILTALHNKGSKAKSISLVTAGKYIFLCKSIPFAIAVITSDSAIKTVVFANITYFDKSTNKHRI
jgi:hypothetical protein